jgi:hypothetical protein
MSLIKELTAKYKVTATDSDITCDMEKDCKEPVTHIDNKGFVYCAKHGEQRKGSVPTRKLSNQELTTIKSGERIKEY